MWYFAYGSNMDAERMRKERKINFLQRIYAVLKNYDLKFNKIASCDPKKGYANIVARGGAIVEGVLYEITDSDLLKLDKCEGYPDHYDKVNVMVQLDNGDIVVAIAYVAQKNKVKDDLKPSKNYLKHLLAAEDILSKSYYAKLATWETLDSR